MNKTIFTNTYEGNIFKKWLNIYKKSAIFFWVLYFLKKKPAYSKEILSFLSKLGLGIDKNSLYRALRRLEYLDLVEFIKVPGKNTGAERKVYKLTLSGKKVLRMMKNVRKREDKVRVG